MDQQQITVERNEPGFGGHRRWWMSWNSVVFITNLLFDKIAAPMKATSLMKKKILLIQTAFIGDVILATGILEKLHQYNPEAQLDLLVQKGNESLFLDHPFLNRVLCLDKKQKKRHELQRLLKEIRHERYDWVINLHRFASSGILTAFSKARRRCGFSKNPLSRLFTHRFAHEIKPDGIRHEIERNHSLIAEWTDELPAKPRLYPSAMAARVIPEGPYICVAPASVWFTKQVPKQGWIDLLNKLPKDQEVHLLGGPGDEALCVDIQLHSRHPRVRNRAGELSLLQSAALMSGAAMNYVNDSAPLHLASAMNAPITAIFCSTVPGFGFGPLSDNSTVWETGHNLSCRPCGIHGKPKCPQGHFKCSEIAEMQLKGIAGIRNK